MSTVALSRGNNSRRSLSSLSTTSTSLSHAISNIDSSKPAVVIEIGTKLTKCGFAGEFVPRAIIRTQFIDESLNLNQDILKGNNGGSRPDISVFFKFFKHIFYSHLLSMPRERRVIIVENILSPTNLRKTICKVLLELLDVPSVMFVPSHLCCTFPFNTDYAVVVDVGYKETLALPIAEGVTMLNSWEISNAGAQLVEERLRILLKDYGQVEGPGSQRRNLVETDWAKIEKNNTIEDISVRFIFCTSIERGRTIQEKGFDNKLDPISEAKLPLGSEFLIIPGYVRLSSKIESGLA
uniref:Actin-related protein 10 n=1 Tax=Heterorhabditis bacteriophora TaxID=37862 RepID=A0A1I7XE79_HETBA